MSTAKWAEIKGPCPVCGHRGWCTCATDGGSVLCRRASSDRPVKQKDGGMAWLHKPDGDRWAAGEVRMSAKAPTQKMTPPEVALRQKQNRTALVPARLRKLADELSLKPEALEAYGIGWDAATGSWSFPMYDGRTNPSTGAFLMCGLRLRLPSALPDGRKYISAKGSRNGLFLPEDYERRAAPVPEAVAAAMEIDDPFAQLICLPEGPTDCAACWGLGLLAVGRPSCNGGGDMLRKLLAGRPPVHVMVVADRDKTSHLPDGTPIWPGLEGAIALCTALEPLQPDPVASLAFVLPPHHKDVRDWCRGGCSDKDLGAAMVNVTGAWLAAARRRLEQRKRDERRKPETD